jgi:mannose/fructose/N-acetylgalactosamine-specific phosphotransferase system component IIC
MSNDIVFGLHFGMLMQLLWISQLPVGAARIPAGNLGSITGVITALQLKPFFAEYQNFIILAGLLTAVFLSFAGAYFNAAMNQFNVAVFNRTFKQIERGNTGTLGRMTAAALLVKLAFLILIVYGFVSAAIYFLKLMDGGTVSLIDRYARFIEMAVIGAGIGLTLNLYKSSKTTAVFTAGIVLGILIFSI